MQSDRSRQPRLFHLQTSTLIEAPQNLTRIRIGKPNPNWSPDIDVSNLPYSDIVSCSHAEIRIQGNAYFIEDLGSANGTFLNHSRLTPFTPCQLHFDDTIDLGKDQLFTFLFRAAKRPSVALSRSSSRNYNRQPNQQQTSSFNILGLILSNLTTAVNTVTSFLSNLMSKLIRWWTSISIRVGVFLIALLVIGLSVALLLKSPSPATSVHLTLGNPNNASTTNPKNYLMIKPQYAISYNRDQGIPNWVSWQLNQSWLGSIDRKNDFRPDTTLPAGWYQVRPSDYTGGGYDRGHMAPSGDRTRNPEDNSATFLMTNMIPQAPQNNREVWRELEEYSKELVFQGKELYIIAGGTGFKRALKGKVTVPKQT